MSAFDAVVVGSGPNGLAAAVTLARAGLAVQLLERETTLGGGARSAELTLPGHLHDVCSAVHPMALASPFFRAFGLGRRVELRVPEISYGHPLDGGRAAVAYRDLDRTVAHLGRDGAAWASLVGSLSRRIEGVTDVASSTMLRLPRHPLVAARLGLAALEMGTPAWGARFRDEEAAALLAGVTAHAIRPMPSLGGAAAGMVLAAHAHAGGWPVPVGGSQAIVDALLADFAAHGGVVETGVDVERLDQLDDPRAVLLDVTPRALVRIARTRLPQRYLRALRRFRYGDGAAKVDFALSGPVPWAAPELAGAGTVHVGGTRAEIAAAENAVVAGRHPAAPYVLVAQPSIVDPTRAPDGHHTLWTYTHVPHGSTVDPTEAVTAQLERFAPGFRDVVLASTARTAAQLEAHDVNYVGGDIASGTPSLVQLIRRPVLSTDPWRTPARGIYLASASTPPGPGVHGLAGWHAARSALRGEFGIDPETVELAP